MIDPNATAPTPTEAPAAPPPPSAPDDAGDDAALLAELDALGSDKPAEEPAAPPAKGESTTEETPEADAESEGEEPDEEPASEDAPPAEEPADPELEKRLKAIQRAEARSREAVQREREQLATERARIERELGERSARAEAFERVAARAKYDPVGVLTALGLGPEDLEPAARALYAQSTEGAKDPRLREHAQRALREREAATELAQTQAELRRLQEQVAADQGERRVEAYLAEVTGSVTASDTPIVTSLLKNDPSGARTKLRQVAEILYRDTGEVADPADVARELEKIERTNLQKYGIDLPSGKTPGKTSSPPVAESTRGKTITAGVAQTPTKPRSEPLSEDELDADILRALASGTLE